MKARVYIETTIPSYLAARPSRDLLVAAHQQVTRDWWASRRNDFDLFISELVRQEAGGGDPEVASARLNLLVGIPVLALNDEALRVARLLVSEGAIPAKAAADALHIATAAVYECDYLLSWNCRHIANAEVQRMAQRIGRRGGFEAPVICTPEELMGDRYGVAG